MRYTKEDVKREYKKAQERLKTFEAHTGFKFKLDKSLLKNTHRRQVVEYLKSIKWGNISEAGVKANTKMLKHVEIEVTPQGPASLGLKPYIIHDKKQAVRLFEATKERQIAERRYKKEHPETSITEFKPNPQTEANIPGQIEYALKYAFVEKLEEWEETRDSNARQNYINNLTMISANATDALTMATGYAIIKLIEKGILDIIELTRNGNNPWIWDLVAVNLFDSNQWANIDAKSGKRLIDEFKRHGLITDKMIIDEVLNGFSNSDGKLGMTLKDVYEMLKDLGYRNRAIRRMLTEKGIPFRNLKEIFEKDE